MPEPRSPSFWSPRTADELAGEQSVQPKTDADLDAMIGAGADFWDDDEAFEEFVAGIYARRAQSRRAEEGEAQSGAA